MKKLFLSLILFFIIITTKSYATDYEIKSLSMEVEVLENQNVRVREYIVQEGYFNGYIRDLVYKNSYSMKFDGSIKSFEESDIYNATDISDIKIYQGITEDQLNFSKGQEFAQVRNASNGDSFVYEISDIENGYSLKMFQESEGESRCYIIEYTLIDVIVLHEDVCELYYNFIGSAFDDYIDKVDIKINLPNNFLEEKPRAWAHGPLDGFIEIVDNKTVSANIYNLYNNTPIDIRLVFNKSLIKTSKKQTNMPAFDKIIEVETNRANSANLERKENMRVYYEHLIREANVLLESKYISSENKNELKSKILKLENLINEDASIEDINAKYNDLSIFVNMLEQQVRIARLKRMNFIAILAFFIFEFIIIFILYKVYIKIDKEHNININVDYYRDIPDDNGPGAVSYLMYKRIKDTAISASLLEIIRKKSIRVEKDINSKDDYIFFDNVKDDLLNEEEKYLKEWFIDIIGDGSTVRLSQIKNESKKYKTAQKFMDNYSTWLNVVQRNVNSKNFFEENIFQRLLYILVVITISIMMIALSLRAGNVFLIFITFIESLVLILYISFCSKRTEVGAEKYIKWNGLRKYLNDFGSFKEKVLPDIILWERYLVYAYLFGIANKLEKAMRLNLKELSDVDMNRATFLNMQNIAFATTLNHVVINSVTQARSVVTSHDSSSTNFHSSSGGGFGGGFSGGGGSGGGGGGGRGF